MFFPHLKQLYYAHQCQPVSACSIFIRVEKLVFPLEFIGSLLDMLHELFVENGLCERRVSGTVASQHLNKRYIARFWGTCGYFRRNGEIGGVLAPIVRDLRVALISTVKSVRVSRTGKCIIFGTGVYPTMLLLVS